MAAKYIYNPSASPQTGVNTGSYGATLRVKDREQGASQNADITTETVLLTFSGTWGNATLNFYVSVNGPGDSPIQWVPAKVVSPSDGTLSTVAATADGAITLSIPSGSYFTAKITDSASPWAHSLTVKARREIEAG